MATGFLSPIGTPTQQFFTDQGVVLAGGLINTYLAGTTTPAPTFTGPNLAVPNPNPIVLDSAGRCPQEVWLQQSVAYKFVITDSNGNPLSVGTFDNISGINDVAGGGGGGGAITSEWIVSPLTPTFVDATHFTLPGNQTTTFTVNRRVYATVTAGTIYGTITASSFGSNTSITVLWDSGALDSGLSSVAYGILNAVNPSIPANESAYKGLLNIQRITSTGPLVVTPGANRARIRMVGGGGGGGGTPSTSGSGNAQGGGGAPGSFLEFYIPSGWQALNGTTLTIGAAGLGVLASAGGNGGSTTFGASATAPGGNGAQASGSVSPGAGVGATFLGFPGVLATAPSTTFTLLSSNVASSFPEWGIINVNIGPTPFVGGRGGSSPFGNGGIPPVSNANGNNATGNGAGGSGASSAGTATTFKGGDGTIGIMIIEEYL
jgi:hypothetical protein